MHPAVIGRRIEITADLDRVTVLCDGKIVADHERVWARHQTITDPQHLAAARAAAAASGSRSLAPPREAEVEIRCLADYDTALGSTRRARGVMTAAKTAPRDDLPPRSPS